MLINEPVLLSGPNIVGEQIVSNVMYLVVTVNRENMVFVAWEGVEYNGNYLVTTFTHPLSRRQHQRQQHLTLRSNLE